MNNLSVAKRLSLGFAIVLVLLCVIVGVSTWKSSQLADNANYYAVNLVPSFKAQKDIAIDLGNIRRFEFRHILSNSEAEMNGLEGNIESSEKRIDGQFEQYAKALVSDDEDKRLMDKAKAAKDAYRAQWVKLRQVSRLTPQDPSKAAEATALAIGPSAQAYEAAHAAISEWWDYNVKLSDLQDKQSAATYASAKSVLFTLAAAAIALGLLAAIWVTRSLLRELGGEPTQAREEAQRIARGDLTGHIAVKAGDTTSLFAALQSMHKSFVETVSRVRESSESVATASAQIAQGNQNLSQRTEEQASALQQTAATMEQLNTTVRNNADSAKQANQLAQGASEVAAQGGAVVGQVVSTMQGISESSRKIGDIIGVIDGIAFQTNILALNAAVEAARAGEQGRGFAVVASEVRSLAQRSAEAAKEIKGLIGRSVEQVGQGTVLVDQAGKTMGEIVDSIKRVSDIVAEISLASQEQSSGISQVGDAVGQMDQVTQQNAALVEESAAAAESLKGQAQQLVQAVAAFKLSGLAAEQPA